jgi:hypothetical protein
MGWKNSPPAFTTATETIADLANCSLKAGRMVQPHQLDERATRFDKIEKSSENSCAKPSVAPDPSIPSQQQPIAEVDVYVDDFIAIAQGDHKRLKNVRATVLHSIDSVFRPNDERDSKTTAEPVSLKKLDKGDASWSTHQTILGWDIDTNPKTITLPLHRKERLAEVPESIPPHQKRIGVTKWHQVFGELRSMSIALPGSRGLFSSLQKALQSHKGNL